MRFCLLAVLLAACAADSETPGEPDATQEALMSSNGLSYNGLYANGLYANGLFSNGLFANGLYANGAFASWLSADGYHPALMKYLVHCALNKPAAGQHSLVYGGYAWDGAIGLAPQWATSGIKDQPRAQELLSACIMAHVNSLGNPVEISLRGGNNGSNNFPNLSVDAAEATDWNMPEGAFWGNIFTNPPKLTVCEGVSSMAGMGIGRDAFANTASHFTIAGTCASLCKTSTTAAGSYYYDCAGAVGQPTITVYDNKYSRLWQSLQAGYEYITLVAPPAGVTGKTILKLRNLPEVFLGTWSPNYRYVWHCARNNDPKNFYLGLASCPAGYTHDATLGGIFTQIYPLAKGALPGDTVPLYQLYKGVSWFYTTSAAERASYKAAGWADAGILGWGSAP